MTGNRSNRSRSFSRFLQNFFLNKEIMFYISSQGVKFMSQEDVETVYNLENAYLQVPMWIDFQCHTS